MSTKFIENSSFQSENYSLKGLALGEYENCNFNQCSFVSTNLSSFTFSECKFENCDLSMVLLKNATFRDVGFKNCKLLGVRFDQCNPFLLSFSFEESILDFSSFYGLKIKNTKFISCKLEQVDFTETDLRDSIFDKCQLSGAVFEDTILEKSDFRTASDFSIDPELNRIKNAKFSAINIAGLLDRYHITIE
ncbi:pentapeptide repeat-containing protein [Gillisia limnaea]|uniref:Pentapeptide repeat protein n=1 Tax=Gillisia limnaea (strain DSM 15749 / LMG 21470 / R-8282) TaxID=865937 RepID=H2BRQ4_GILLR|nr:pentapeptide repeat-containing protein [Gillisia limnaea]EHQ01369.1 pentapeptide repeat protein [Gillisia limnaea DSM 15749]